MIKRLPVPLNGGVNLFDDPTAIGEGQWQRLRNLATRQTGILGQRQSMSFVREVVPSWYYWDSRAYFGLLGVASAIQDYWRWAENIRPLKFIFDPNFGEISMVAITTDAIVVSDETAPGSQTTISVPDNTMLLITLPGVLTGRGDGNQPALRCAVLGVATRDPSLFTFNGETYAFNGYDSGSHVVAELSTPVNFSYTRNDFGTGNEDFAPQGACVVRDRVVYYIGSRIYWSDRNDPLTVSTTGVPAVGTRDIYLGGEELEDITAVAELSTSADGSPVQSVAAVWTSNHCYLLLGEPGESTETDVLGSLQINRLNVEAGCVSQASVVRTPYGTLWAGVDDIWFMPFGSLPIRVGTSIRPLLEGQPNGLRWRLHAEYYNGFYRLSLFTPGQGPAMYDPCGMQMWLDLRGGAPRDANSAVWVGPQEFVQTDAPAINGGEDFGGQPGVWCMARDTRATGDKRLYALQRYAMGGFSALSVPEIKGMSLCGFDTQDGRDTCAPQAVRQPWAANTAYYEGDLIVPRSNTNNIDSPIFRCAVDGISGLTEPNWFGVEPTGEWTETFPGSVTWVPIYWDPVSDLPMSAYTPNLMQSGNEIEWSQLSREHLLGDPMAEKLLDGAELGYWTNDRTQLTYNSHPKQDSRSRILGLDAEQTADNVANQTTGDRVWQRKLLTPDPTKRFHGLSAMWECQQDAGIVITEGVNDTMVINGQTATVAAGYYADITALDSYIRVACALAAGADVQSTIQQDGGIVRALYGLRIDAGFGGGDICQIGTGSRLANLLGYSAEQGATVDSVNPEYSFGYESPRTAFAPDMQISGLNLRFKLFGRRPT